MILAAADATAWYIGYAVGFVVVVLVVALLLLIIRAARGIAAVAEDATRALAQTKERTEVLWEVGTTNQVATDILGGATAARTALGG